jgi:hypothetical protein
LAMPGRPDLDLLPHEVVGRAFLVDHRRHSHERILAARLAIVSCEQFGPCRTVFDWYASGIGDRIKDGRGSKSGGSGRSRR